MLSGRVSELFLNMCSKPFSSAPSERVRGGEPLRRSDSSVHPTSETYRSAHPLKSGGLLVTSGQGEAVGHLQRSVGE